MILLQLKSSHGQRDLKDIGTVIKKITKRTGYRIQGHEIQHLSNIANEISVKERADTIIKFCRDNGIKYLTYHSPIYDSGENIWEDRWKQQLKHSVVQTVREADLVATSYPLRSKVTVIVHLTNYVPLTRLPITRTDKFDMMDKAEAEFLRVADELNDRYSDTCQFAVENSYPKYYNGYATTGPFHPIELAHLQKFGVKAAFDISHYTLYSNYLGYGTGNQCGDLDREIYKEAPDWRHSIRILSNSLVQLHISDAKGYMESGEGLSLGQGEIASFGEIFAEINNSVRQLVQGTIELSEGHLHSAKFQLESAIWLIDKLAPELLWNSE